jgi:hypothetical protein
VCLQEKNPQIRGSRLPWLLNFLRLLLIQYESAVGNVLHVTLLARVILKCLLDFWKICGPFLKSSILEKRVFVGHGKCCIFNTEYSTDFINKESQNPIQIRSVVNKLLENKEQKETWTVECSTAQTVTSLQTHKNCWRNSVPCNTHCSHAVEVLFENNSVC